MSIDYKINPAKATCASMGDNTEMNIQEMNDTCFGICGAFSGTVDVYNMDPECSKSCTNLIEQRKKQLFGVGSCDHQVPYRPVLWDETPRFVPKLLRDGFSPEHALSKCMQLCHSNYDSVACKEKCKLDYSAIETQSKEAFHNFSVGSTSHRPFGAPSEQPLGRENYHNTPELQSPIEHAFSLSSWEKMLIVFACILFVVFLIVCIKNNKSNKSSK